MKSSENTDMNNPGHKEDSSLTEKYTVLMSIISSIEARLGYSDLFYLFMNVFVFLFIVTFVSYLLRSSSYVLIFIDLAFIFSCIIVGMALNVYWIAFAMRIQLKLKLHYFQVRYMERMMNCEGACIYSDANTFFDPDIRMIESPDNKETLYYPTSGPARMDGFVGSLKPRHFSWLLPCLFILLYWVIFFLVIPFA